MVYEVQTGATLLVQALMGISRDGFTLVALLGYLLYLNWQLTLIVAVVVPAVTWIMKTLSRRLYRITKASQQATDELAYVVEENVLAHRMVRLHGAQAVQQERFGQLSDSLRRLALKAVAMLLLGMFFAFLYYAVPNAPVSRRAAACGGLFASVAFALMQKFFEMYLVTSAMLKSIYGAFAAFPVFLVWLHLSWAVVLLGGLISAALTDRGKG